MSIQPSVSLIGLGAFGRLAAESLGPHADVVAHDPDPHPDPAEGPVPLVGLDEACARPTVVLAVPVQALATVLDAVAPRLGPDTMVCDVCSVKVGPCRLMDRRVPAGCHVVGLHPLFGPQTARERGTIAGQRIAVCPVRVPADRAAGLRSFLADRLALQVVETTPDEHDRQMATVQVLTHLVGHAAVEMDLPELPLATVAYQRLLQMKRNTERDSPELFAAIQTHNPYADAARRRFIQAMGAVIARAEDSGASA